MTASAVGAPRVSVGLPVYNGARYVARSLESLLAQDMPDLEVIVSDNGSKDDTLAICQAIAARDARVRVIAQPVNRGGAWNFNEVFRFGRAPFFKWACHDDWCEPSYLRRCLEEFEKAGPRVVLVYPRTVLVDGAGEVIGEYDDRMDVRGATPHQRLRQVFRNLSLCNAAQGLIRRSALERTRLHGAFPGSDQILLTELAMQGEFREVPEPLFYRRRHAEASREANKTLQEVAAWFDPDARGGFALRFVVQRENLASIARAPLPLAERLRCAATYLGVYATRRARVWVGSLRRRWVAKSAPNRLHAREPGGKGR